MTEISSVSGLRGVREALAELFGLVESGELVRDISRDGESDWLRRAAKLTLTLKKAQLALSLPPSPQAPTDEEPRKYWPMGCGHSSYWRIDELDQCELCELRKAAEEGIDANTLRSSPAGAQGQVQGVQAPEIGPRETKEQYEARMLWPDLTLRGKATDHIWCMEDVEGYIGVRMDCGDAGTVYLTKSQAAELATQLTSLAVPPADVSSQAGHNYYKGDDVPAAAPSAGSGQEGLRELVVKWRKAAANISKLFPVSVELQSMGKSCAEHADELEAALLPPAPKPAAELLPELADEAREMLNKAKRSDLGWKVLTGMETVKLLSILDTLLALRRASPAHR